MERFDNYFLADAGVPLLFLEWSKQKNGCFLPWFVSTRTMTRHVLAQERR